MRIAFYCSSLSWGGLEMNVLKRAQWMTNRGHDIVLYCVKDTQLFLEASNNGIVRIQTVQRNKKSFDLRNAFRVKKLLQNEKTDLVWFADKRDLSLIFLVKWIWLKSLKVLFQQSMQLGVNKKEWWHTIRFKRIDFWIAPLNYLAEQVLNKTHFPKERIHVVPQGLEVQKFLDELPSKEEARSYFDLEDKDIVVGMIGRIDYAKSQRFVMDVVKDLQDEFKCLKMLMVGNKTEGEWEEYYEEIVKEIQDLKSPGTIQLFPFMKEVGYFYKAIDIFVMASKNETYGMVTIEAMLSGNKIVGTNAAGTKELLDNTKNGYYFNWMDDSSLKEALKHILTDPKTADEKASRAKEIAVSSFSHENELAQIEEIVQS